MGHPVALAVDVPVGTVTGTRLEGVEVAIWRDPTGQIHVWRDLCPHRGMRLSLGHLRDATLACPYHGWRFDPSGRCVHIPAHPRALPPTSVSVQRYHAAEAHGIIWAGPAAFEPPVTTEPAHAVRSVTIRRAAATVTTALEARMLRPGPWGYRVGPVSVAVQPVDERVTALHAVHLGPASDDLLVSLAQQLGRLRSALDAG